MLYCLDTNTCIAILRGTGANAIERFKAAGPERLRLPAMVVAELLLGAARSVRPAENMKTVERFIEPIEIVPFDRRGAEEYATIRAELQKAGTPIGPNDLVIAATVLACGGVLVTANRREFSRVRRLHVESWE